MAVKGAQYEPRTRAKLRPGEWLCFVCNLDDCDEKDQLCLWRKFHAVKKSIHQWWIETERKSQ